MSSICLGVIPLSLLSCQSEGEAEAMAPPPETLQSLQDLRSRIAVSDEELILAIERLTKVEAAWREAIAAGLVTEQEIAGMFATMPETMLKLDQLESELLAQDAMAAAVALTVLQHHHDNTLENILPQMRRIISDYYRSVASKPSEAETGFLKRVEQLAGRDEELALLLKGE